MVVCTGGYKKKCIFGYILVYLNFFPVALSVKPVSTTRLVDTIILAFLYSRYTRYILDRIDLLYFQGIIDELDVLPPRYTR